MEETTPFPEPHCGTRFVQVREIATQLYPILSGRSLGDPLPKVSGLSGDVTKTEEPPTRQRAGGLAFALSDAEATEVPKPIPQPTDKIMSHVPSRTRTDALPYTLEVRGIALIRSPLASSRHTPATLDMSWSTSIVLDSKQIREPFH
eukprot:1180921-Prorocentrum_minimum.AAC.4